jgi:predicted nuclease with RNAse H fold
MVFMSYSGHKFKLESEVYKGVTDEQIEELHWKFRPKCTAIDAPLSAVMEKIRPAEPKLRELVRAFSPEISAEGSVGSPFGLFMFPITYRGKYLAQRLGGITDVIETHPLINYLFLDGDTDRTELYLNRKNDTKVLRDLLNKHVEDLPADLDDDQLDAIMCGMIACLYVSEEPHLKLQTMPKHRNTDNDFVVLEVYSPL